MKQSLLEMVVAYIFGRKYWANIVNTRGTEKMELACFIFRTKGEAESHRKSLDTNRSFAYVETISFRSRNEY